MEKTVAAFEARRRFGKILEGVAARGDHIVIERHGEPVAAIVPLWIYQNWQRAREELLESMERASKRANLSPEEAEVLVEEAVRAVRAANPR